MDAVIHGRQGQSRILANQVCRGAAGLLVALGLLFRLPFLGSSVAASPADTDVSPGLSYTNCRVPEIPWSIHVVKLARTNTLYEIHSAHAGARALGMSTLSDQMGTMDKRLGQPVAAINGDFYLRDKIYAGGPRGLQVVNGELLSAPRGGAAVWIDLLHDAHLAMVTSEFRIEWPDGRTTPFGLNADRGTNGVELYTPAVGPSTRTTNGSEWLLERLENTPWLPLRAGRTCLARVRAVRAGGDSPLAPDIMVLSLAPAIAGRFSDVRTGAILRISTDMSPVLRGALTALSGGPVLVRNGRPQKIVASVTDAYESSSMLERHPRSAVGWNRDCFFLVEVDGRQRDLSDGMTLEELSTFLVKLGCEEAMNLDGGGSSTLWFRGQVRNSPCDGYERPIANSLVIVRRPARSSDRPNGKP